MQFILLCASLLLCSGSLALALDENSPVVVGKTFSLAQPTPDLVALDGRWRAMGLEKLFTVDKEGEIIGQIAKSVHKVSETTWDVTLKSGYKFSDGTVVTAKHVADCLLELNKMNPSAQSSLDVMTVTVRGELVVRIESTRVTHVMDAVLASGSLWYT